MVVAAINEETFPEIEQHAKTVYWMSLGQLGKLIKTFKSEGVNHAPESFSEHFLLRFRSSICGLRKGAVRVNVHYEGPVVNGYATGAQSGYVVATLARAKACG